MARVSYPAYVSYKIESRTVAANIHFARSQRSSVIERTADGRVVVRHAPGEQGAVMSSYLVAPTFDALSTFGASLSFPHGQLAIALSGVKPLTYAAQAPGDSVEIGPSRYHARHAEQPDDLSADRYRVEMTLAEDQVETTPRPPTQLVAVIDKKTFLPIHLTAVSPEGSMAVDYRVIDDLPLVSHISLARSIPALFGLLRIDGSVELSYTDVTALTSSPDPRL